MRTNKSGQHRKLDPTYSREPAPNPNRGAAQAMGMLAEEKRPPLSRKRASIVAQPSQSKPINISPLNNKQKICANTMVCSNEGVDCNDHSYLTMDMSDFSVDGCDATLPLDDIGPDFFDAFYSRNHLESVGVTDRHAEDVGNISALNNKQKIREDTMVCSNEGVDCNDHSYLTMDMSDFSVDGCDATLPLDDIGPDFFDAFYSRNHFESVGVTDRHAEDVGGASSLVNNKIAKKIDYIATVSRSKNYTYYKKLLENGLSKEVLNGIKDDLNLVVSLVRFSNALIDDKIYEPDLLENIYGPGLFSISTEAMGSLKHAAGGYSVIKNLMKKYYTYDINELVGISRVIGFGGLYGMKQVHGSYQEAGFSKDEFTKIYIRYHETDSIRLPLQLSSLLKIFPDSQSLTTKIAKFFLQNNNDEFISLAKLEFRNNLTRGTFDSAMMFYNFVSKMP